MLVPSRSNPSSHHSGFMTDSRGALRARLESIAAPAILVAMFLLMTAVVLVRSAG